MIDYEHDARWSDALLCYEQALQDLNDAQQKRLPDGSVSAGSGGERAAAADLAPHACSPLVATLHAGLLRCLQNVGHLETVLNRAVGVLGRSPELSPAVTPYAVEAAWRLGQWQPLEELLSFQVDEPLPRAPALNIVDAGSGSSRGGGAGASTPADSILTGYNVLLGSTMLALHKHAHLPGVQRAGLPPVAASMQARGASSLPGSSGVHTVSVVHAALQTVYDAAQRQGELGMLGFLTNTLLLPHTGFSNLCVSPGAAAAVTGLFDGKSGCGTAPRSLGTGSDVAAAGGAGGVRAALAAARADIMPALAAASTESYSRAYPFLLRLHSLREVEQCMDMLCIRDASARSLALKQRQWDVRLRMVTPSLAQREPLLAVRRAVFRELQLRE
ncbi:MAG: hypothetical protein EOO41_04710, partial [Methanobacteriota archaeon]